MQNTNLNDVACCPNGFKLVVGNRHIKLDKRQSTTQCSANEKFTTYSNDVDGYSVYRTNDGWVLKNGNNWIKHAGGDDCCPRDGSMINFQYPKCDKPTNPECKDEFGRQIVEDEHFWPQGVKVQIHCA